MSETIYPDFIESTQYGTAGGLCGVNCRHSFGIYFPDSSITAPTEEQLAAQHERDTNTKPYKWTDKRGVDHEKDFTLRNALDRQREMERAMRATRKEAVLMKNAGMTDEYTALKAKFQAQSDEYKRFSAAMEIIEQRNRIFIDGLGRI